MQWDLCLVCLDGIVVIADSFEQHSEIVLEHLKTAAFKSNFKKCNFFFYMYMGHLETFKGLSKDLEQIKRVKEWGMI